MLANLFLLFGVVNPAETLVVGGWSIGVEVVFYIIFPLLMILRGLAFHVVLAVAFLGACINHDLSQYGSLADGWALYVNPANHAVFFCAGVFMRLVNRRFDGLSGRCW